MSYDPTHPNVELNAAKQFAKDNLLQCIKELEEWNSTSVLCNGKLRELATLCNFGGNYNLSIAENLVKDAAMQFVVKIANALGDGRIAEIINND